MTWQKRLRDIALAGGAVAMSGCFGTPCGNGNPDPCICGRPSESAENRAACDAQTACEASGGTFDPTAPAPADGGPDMRCQLPGADGGSSDGGGPSDGGSSDAG